MPIDLKNWFRNVRGKQEKETYVDFAEIPAEPEGPYRARAVTGARRSPPAGFEVSERQVVHGELQVVHREQQVLYLTRCPCGYRWTSPQFQRMAVCPKCDRAVLLTAPPAPAEP